jgi:protein involved in polysaccharide export with SLBB domain
MNRLLCVSVWTVACLAAGCAARDQSGTLAPQADVIRPTAPEPLFASTGGATDVEYVLQIEDVIEVRFSGSPEFNVRQPIRPDGKIGLELVGDIQAAGQTPGALRAMLAERYADTLRDPQIAVIVAEYPTRKVYVGGEVRTPSLLELNGPLTALQAIMQTGGFTTTAARNSVVILRYQGTSEPAFLSLRVDDLLARREPDVVLRPFDIVYVPKTFIGRLDDFMNQYVRELIPITLSVGISYFIGLP